MCQNDGRVLNGEREDFEFAIKRWTYHTDRGRAEVHAAHVQC